MSRSLFEKLAKEHFILYFNGILVVTNKFYRVFKTPPPPEPEVKQEVSTVVQKATILPPATSGLIVQENTPRASPLFKFIKDCQIPEKIRTTTGFYRPNQFSLPAEKALIKLLTEGYNYDILVTATKLYYKSNQMPKNLSNYLVDGIWQGCYEDMKTSLESGTTSQHINQKLDNKGEEDGNTRYRR